MQRTGLRRGLFVARLAVILAASVAAAAPLTLEFTPEAREKLVSMKDLTLEWATYMNT